MERAGFTQKPYRRLCEMCSQRTISEEMALLQTARIHIRWKIKDNVRAEKATRGMDTKKFELTNISDFYERHWVWFKACLR